MNTKNVQDMNTPALVREYTAIKCQGARGEDTTLARHLRLSEVVTELRSRSVLD